ncbi:F-box only protein 21-like [Nylanderia fulva]|uniref:F-box only protein 21-like n=1 Tax=Nylanderia fulva TaxID=613905 RepID=UPI0010FB6C38|nr:F-box only protein 21-like [Nylanderia fulva]
MSTIINLPFEIIYTILQYESISIQDIVNFRSTCKQFRCAIDCITLWPIKFKQRWPHANVNYNMITKKDININKNNLDMNNDNNINDYFTLKDVQKGIEFSRNIRQYVSSMSEKYYYCNDRYENQNIFIEDLDHLIYLDMKNQYMNFFFLADELIRLIYKQDLWQSNLTERYYSIQLFQYLNRNMLKSRLRNFMRQHKQLQRLEDIIVIILEWYHPEKFFFLHTDQFIDNIVQEVLKVLKNVNPTHPIFLLSSNQFFFWKNNNIDRNYWNENELWIKLNEIDMFDLYCYKIEDRERDYKRMISMIIYTCVARRLGLYFEISTHYSLFSFEDIHLTWKDIGTSEDYIENKECFIIKCKHDEINLDIIDQDLEIQDLEEIHSTLIIEKCQIVSNPRGLSLEIIIEALIRILGYYSLWPMEGSSDFCGISSSIRNYDVSIGCPKDVMCKRSPKIKYAIGLIVRHKHLRVNNGLRHSSLVGVIIGWHHKYQMERFRFPGVNCIPYYIKDEYIKKRGIRDWNSQPYYILLVDNDLCYIPQCTITSICSEWINNAEIGRYFCKFEGTHYVSNEMLSKQYMFNNNISIINAKYII